MLDVVIWGLVQGLTEFLPISSSGHLILVPAFLSELGFEVGEPTLAVTAVLHLGTLLAVLVYYRHDVLKLLRFGRDPEARNILWLLFLGTLPALVGLPLADSLDAFDDDPQRVAMAMLVTAGVLFVGTFLTVGTRVLERGRIPDAILVGIAQATALVPGISRSGMTITAGLGRRFSREEAARYAFLLSVPTIAGGGLLSLAEATGSGVAPLELLVGLVTAAVSGYAAIAILLRTLARVGFLPFAIYALIVAVTGIVVF